MNSLKRILKAPKFLIISDYINIILIIFGYFQTVMLSTFLFKSFWVNDTISDFLMAHIVLVSFYNLIYHVPHFN